MWQNRIVAHEDMPVGELTAHPLNWRKHPKAQASALTGALREVGLVQSVIWNRRTKRLIDGHLRVELAMAAREATLPVTVVDLSEDEERTVLATLDPIGAMAIADKGRLDELLASIHAKDAELVQFLAGQKDGLPSLDAEPQLDGLEYRVVVECDDEQDQAELIRQLESGGRKCKPLIS